MRDMTGDVLLFVVYTAIGLSLCMAGRYLATANLPGQIATPIFVVAALLVGASAGAIVPQSVIATSLGTFTGALLSLVSELPPEVLAVIGALPLFIFILGHIAAIYTAGWLGGWWIRTLIVRSSPKT